MSILLNPLDSLPYFLGVIIERPTGVVYANQCDGFSARCQETEGFYVPLGGLDLEREAYRDDSELETLFRHPTPEGQLSRLRNAVGGIPFWVGGKDGTEKSMQLDESRLDEICEAWVPVLTPLGRGILVWGNCD